MKKIFAALALASMLAASGIIYPATMRIESIDGDVVHLETAAGLRYEFTGAEDYETGDVVSLLMFSAGTPDDVTDDVIISARYSGWTV